MSVTEGSPPAITLILSSTQHHQLNIAFEGYDSNTYNRFWLRLFAEQHEHIYGAGEQFSYFDLRGRNYPIWTREQGVGRNYSYPVKYLADIFQLGSGGDYHTTYFPQASFVSSRKYYCHMIGSSYIDMSFKASDFHEILIHNKPDSVGISTSGSMAGVVQNLYGYFGTQHPLPEWLSEGTVIGMQGGTDRMMNTLKTCEENELSVTGFWIQDWSGSLYTSFGKRVYWNWEWDPEKYPGLDKDIWNLKEKGVHILAYITAHLITTGSIYKEVEGMDYFMKNKNGENYLLDFVEFWCATVDLTNPEAREWYKGIIKKNLIEFGFSGWMADFGEYIPYDGVFHNGETGLTIHNKFPMVWAQLNREVVEEAGKLGEIMFFMRAGGPGSQRYSTNFWAGDQNVDWSYSDGLATTIPAALSLGMSGFGLTHFDIGGYTTVYRAASVGPVFVNLTMVRTSKLFFRGAEHAVFTPMMRTHEGNIPEKNFQVYSSKDDIERFSTLVKMFKALSKYTRMVMEENQMARIPVQRPLFLHYEDDETLYSIGYEYMLGR